MFWNKKAAAVPSLQLGITSNFSELVLIAADGKNKITETVIHRDGRVKVTDTVKKELYISTDEFPAGSEKARSIIKNVDGILADNQKRVTRHLFTTPHLTPQGQ